MESFEDIRFKLSSFVSLLSDVVKVSRFLLWFKAVLALIMIFSFDEPRCFYKIAFFLYLYPRLFRSFKCDSFSVPYVFKSEYVRKPSRNCLFA